MTVSQERLLALAVLLYREKQLETSLSFQPMYDTSVQTDNVHQYGWILLGPYRPPCFVEPGQESDCNDFAVPGISKITDQKEAFELVWSVISSTHTGQ